VSTNPSQLRYINGVTDYFDSQGRMVAAADARGNRHEYTYDVRGRLPLVGASKESIAPTQPMTVAYTFRLTRIDERGANGGKHFSIPVRRSERRRRWRVIAR
jgi:hypothetical protein